MAAREIAWPRDVTAIAASLARHEHWFWLDGAAPEPNGARGRSYLGVAAEVRHAARGREHEFLDELRASSTEWVAAFSYEFGVAMMGEDAAADDAPPAFALRPETVLVLDHATGRAELRGADDAAIDAWLVRFGAHLRSEIDAQSERIGGFSPTEGRSPTERAGASSDATLETTHWRRSECEYMAEVEACKAAIRDGEAYVLCLTDMARAMTGKAPLELYLSLRQAAPELRGAVIVAGQRALVSGSPERFLSVRGRVVSTHPIKGTRRRGETSAQDATLAHELANDPKERAENLMIVDLMRNDLSRVCEVGTVAVEGFLRVEQHPRVHQLVSTVTGRLREDADAFDALRACFPGGSMTGAPKRRAVQLLAATERAPRGLYSGCFGLIGPHETELAMTIRSIELRGAGPHKTVRIGAGGGITADSDAAAEYAEKNLKAAPLIGVLEAEA